MAAKVKRALKTNVFWSKDSDDQDERIVKVHVPGVAPEACLNIKNPMVRKPVHMLKQRGITLQKSFHDCLDKREQEMPRNGLSAKSVSHSFDHFGEGYFEQKGKEKQELSLKELNPQDKKRVANLVKELAKVGEERQLAEEKIEEERLAFEERLAILQEEYDAVIKEKAYLQNRFLELQALLVKFQANGRTSSPRKTAKTPTTEDKEQPPHFSPSKQPITEIPGNTRPDTSNGKHTEEKLKANSFQASFSQQVMNKTTPPNKRCRDQKSQITAHQNSVTEGHMRVLSPGQPALPSTVQSRSECHPVAASSKVQSTEIQLSSSQKEGPSYKSAEPSGTSLSMATQPQPSSADSSQSATRVAPGMMSQHPLPVKPLFSMFSDGDPGLTTDRKVPPRKNEDRSFSEVSGVSGSFSAELDAVYRLYCREYELQLHLQQQQIELQKQQLQLQQQLQQVENLQQQHQQQQQRQQQQQQQQKLLSSMEMETKVTGHEKPATSTVDETPARPLVPRPASQPRQVSPAQSLIPTPEVSSSSNHGILQANPRKAKHSSTSGILLPGEEGLATAEVYNGNAKDRLGFEKENIEALAPDPHYRVQSAPPTLSQPRFSFERERGPQPPADRTYRRAIVPDDRLPTPQEHVDERAKANYPDSRLSGSRYSLHSRSHDVSANGKIAALREIQNTEKDMVSGRDSNSSFYPRSNFDFNSEQGSLTVDSLRADSFLGGRRQNKGESSYHGPPLSHSHTQGSFKRQAVASDQRFSLYSDVERSSQSRGSHTFPDDDDRPGRLDPSLESGVRENPYPLSLVDIVENLESKSLGLEVPAAVRGLDTTDSGYSQETNKERSPRIGDIVNSDEEEAAVLEDIFFISGRFL
ncbi:uncharacterized protein LOC111344274 isoform X3 [Stylophora pistillata]|uniref:uncharacterized protein LOC111344274 isoform X3 n=1 Tax=Stylophora pistillata TaxID=50429 RepID=UPI000C054CCA|nr:uncharacterized protein LOC111344274 isoform X3 [Stylophora pistillata]